VHRWVFGGVAALFVLLLTAAGPAFSGAPAQLVPAASVQADLDRDKLFDDLETVLARKASGAKVEVIVALRGGATIRALESQVGAIDVTSRFRIVRGFAATVTKAQAERLARLPGVVRVERNARVHTMNNSTQSSFGVTAARSQDATLDGNCEDSTNPTCTPGAYGADDLVAAVIDTGIDAGHRDLDGGKVIGFANCLGTGPCTEVAAFDDEGHGSHVSATIAGDGEASGGTYKGVAPEAALVGIKVLNSLGSGSIANVIEGIQWAIDNRARFGIEAINLSLGLSGCSDGTDSTSVAVNNAAAAGIVVAVAAGNEGPGACTIGSPAAAAGALTVGAMADLGENGFSQASWSSRGFTADGRRKPDVSAPGVSVTSAEAGTGDQYVAYSGTSMATPFTAGTALLMLDANPALSQADVKCKVMSTAIDWGRPSDNGVSGCSSTVDRDYGAGRLDGFAALASAGAALGTAPAMPAHQVKEGTLSGDGDVVDYPLTITSTDFPIAATLIHAEMLDEAAGSPDFDIFLYDPAGTQLISSESITRQEDLGYDPNPAAGGAGTGTYTLRVLSYSGSGPYFVDVSAPLGPPVPDTTPPTVASTSPADGAVAVSATTAITTTFSEAMDQASAQSVFSLVRSSDGVGVSGTFSWSGNAMTFRPSAALTAATQYTAKVAVGARDVAGNELAADRIWSFTVARSFVAHAASTTIQTGTYRSGSVANLASDTDGLYYAVNSTSTSTRTTSWYGTFTGIDPSLSNLRAIYRGKNSRSVTQRISIWRWTTSSWVQLNSATVGTTERTFTLTPGGAVSDYVSAAGDLRVRVRGTTTGGTFYASGNLLRITYDAP
jgi:serine protease AprX